MASQDETVVREHVVRILQQIRREGWRASFATFQHEEPVLAGYALAAADTLAERLARSGVPRRIVIGTHIEFMTAQLVCIESMRQASRQLWQDFLPGAESETKQ